MRLWLQGLHCVLCIRGTFQRDGNKVRCDNPKCGIWMPDPITEDEYREAVTKKADPKS